MSKNHLVIVTPVWKRPILTLAYLAQMERWRDHARTTGLPFSVVIVGSEEEASRSLVRGRSCLWYVEHPNQPLGGKFNRGVEKALQIGASHVLIMGSDQFADTSILDHYARLMNEDVPYAGVLDTYVWDTLTGEALYWQGYDGKRQGAPVGPGRLIRRDVLESNGGTLYDTALSKNLDGSADSWLPEPVTFLGKPYRFVSVKTEGSITPAERYTGPKVEARMFYDFIGG